MARAVARGRVAGIAASVTGATSAVPLPAMVFISVALPVAADMVTLLPGAVTGLAQVALLVIIQVTTEPGSIEEEA